MKYLITESQLKRLIERGPNSPAYRGPEGYDDSCDCYVDEESEEETEGVGGYAAPAFEMEPDHTHFKHIYNEREEITERCWPGYTQKGMKTMFGKRYPNCVKKK